MTVFSFHEHELKPNANVENYEIEIQRTLVALKIPGLLQVHLVKGFKGERCGRYGVLWIWENEQCIKDNFGTLDNPKWPADWLHYENEILAKYLTCHPDKILFTAYNIIGNRIANPENSLLSVHEV